MAGTLSRRRGLRGCARGIHPRMTDGQIVSGPVCVRASKSHRADNRWAALRENGPQGIVEESMATVNALGALSSFAAV
jgi:hypothetical protein